MHTLLVLPLLLYSLAQCVHALPPPQARLAPIRTKPVPYLPLDLYASSEPSFAGAPISLSISPAPSSPDEPGPGRYAMTYTPYAYDSSTARIQCKDDATVRADLARISAAGFSAIRLLSTDCRALATVATTAINLSLRLILGLHITELGPSSADVAAQLDDLASFARASGSHVDIVTVGNEALFNAYATPAELVALLARARASLRAAGYAGPVTTAEPTATLLEHAALLCPALDLVAANLLPFFQSDVPAAQAGEYARGQMAELGELCEVGSGVDASKGDGRRGAAYKSVVAMEVGWPSRGSANGEALPGRLEQRVALAGLSAEVGSRAVFGAFEDEEWREPGEFGVETHWGCMDIFE